MRTQVQAEAEMEMEMEMSMEIGWSFGGEKGMVGNTPLEF